MCDVIEPINISKLHLSSKDALKFLVYAPLYSKSEDCEVEEWIENSTYICEDTNILLTMDNREFWEQILLNKSLHDCITSYLRNAPRPHDYLTLPHSTNPTVINIEENLSKNFFLICLRAAINKESSSSTSLIFAENEFVNLIYDRSVFDIPRLLDFCAIYSKDNSQHVRKMVASIFKMQPKYYEDTIVMVTALFDVFSAIEKKLGLDNLEGPKRLSDCLGGRNLKDYIEFRDLVFYVSDVSNSLLSFLQCVPSAAYCFCNNAFPQRLAEFYENYSSNIYSNLNKFSNDKTNEFHTSDKLKNLINATRVNLLSIFNAVIKETIFEKLNSNEEGVGEMLLDKFIDTHLSTMASTRFVSDYERVYPFKLAVDYIVKYLPSTDASRFDYIVEAIESACNIYPAKRSAGAQKETGAIAFTYGTERIVTEATSSTDTTSLDQVMELFPDLDTELVCQCLSDNNNDPQKVINYLLENPSKKDKASTVDNGQTNNGTPHNDDINPYSILSDRLNIFDGDEFDAFKGGNNFNPKSAHIGKKDKDKIDQQDEQLKNRLKPLYDKYANEFRYGSVYDEDIEYAEVNMYEDEYDDTYDTLGVEGDLDPDSADELSTNLTSRREGYKYSDKYLEQSITPGNTDFNKASGNSKNFLEDPAELRRIRKKKKVPTATLR